MRAHVVTSIEELSEQEDRWEALRQQCGGTVYSSNFMIRSWFEACSASASPRVILVEDDGDLVGIAPLCSYRYKVKGLPIRVITLAGDMSGKIRLTTNSVLYDYRRADVLERILREIKRLNWSVLWTINMERSAAVDHYLERVRSTWNVVDCDVNKGLEIPLAPTGDLCDTYDSNARRNFRKIVNRLEREGVEARLERVEAEGIDRAVDEYARQHIERWESRGGSYFRDPDNVAFMKLSTKGGYDRQNGFVYQMRINGEVAAQVFGYIEGKRAYAKRLGMDDRFARYSPGWLICNRFLTLLRDQGAEGCDMGWGRERYKYEMGGRETQLVGIGATRGLASFAARIALGSDNRGLGSLPGTMNGSAGSDQCSAQSMSH
ncbi:MAG: GNAT family N-acetyltransferase [Methanomassiliicoccus sp.]|nr:GNAT family N-acetyltransferase [Methanomassiliicoccus sp.]